MTETQRLELRVPGIACEGCAATVRAALEGVAGLASTEVDVSRKRVTVCAAPGASLDVSVIRKRLEGAGYPPE